MSWNKQIRAIKCETEAEGADFAKIAFFNGIAKEHGVPLIVKIGGCEALNDIQQIININADGVIAPMIESAFAAKKFCSAVRMFSYIFRTRTITIETETAISNLLRILDASRNVITNITFGRSDLSDSYADGRKPNDDVIWNVLESAANKLKLDFRHLKLTVGGAIDSSTFSKARHNFAQWSSLFDLWETRRFVVDFSACQDDELLNDILNLEAFYEDRYYRTFAVVASKNVSRAGTLFDRAARESQSVEGVDADEYRVAYRKGG